MSRIERNHEFALNAIGDVLRIPFLKSAGRVIEFVVQIEVKVNDAYLPVVRWDTAHGFAHRDHLDWDGATHHWDRMRHPDDFAASLTEAIDDAETNWERCRSDFFRRKPGN